MRVVKNTPDEGSPSLRMRGKAFHNHLAAQVARDFLRAGFGVWAEYGLRLPDGQTDFVDVLAGREGATIACEVETTARHVLENVAKAQALQLTLWVVVPNRQIWSAVARKVRKIHRTSSAVPVQILLVGEVSYRLTRCFPSFSAANDGLENGKTIPERKRP
jgi:hypothetical protein